MWDKVKAFGLWVYNWITVIGALSVSSASYVLTQLEALAVIDFGSILPPATALKVIAGIAAVKAACTLIIVFNAWLNKPEVAA